MKLAIALTVMSLSAFYSGAAFADSNITLCDFEHMRRFSLTFGGGVGASDNTLTIGKSPPIELSVGSSLMSAGDGRTSYTISLSPPASVTVFTEGDTDSRTFFGECYSASSPVAVDLAPFPPQTPSPDPETASSQTAPLADSCDAIRTMALAYAEMSFRANTVAKTITVEALRENLDNPASSHVKSQVAEDLHEALSMDQGIVATGILALMEACPDRP